jgi:acetylornithine deacetylase/succinyl-diaminopimelate desuccinylase-like protein
LNVLDYMKRDEIVELGCDLIRQPSLTRQEGPAVSFARDWFEEKGFDEIELQEVEPGRKQVIARLRGDGSGRSMMFNGHLDIDPIV